ncbi:MaoC family dehydratase [Ferrovibrio sp.]|uniref:MaoC family dehydratase n=1 Tax=Ferrovibrio sp. TaxID=1917215 RepID=UPI001B69CF39|nr:MaoC family dehydratase [Ferrovibrio sp.]MBP7063630.1 MaoC family dehydratase [Ferrovibrio sp.]
MLNLAALTIGQRIERPGPALTQASFITFGRLHGTDAPIHTDPAYAAKTPFGGTIAHGMMLLAVFESWLCALFGAAAWDQGARFRAKLLNTVKAGEPTTYSLEVIQRDAGSITLALALHSGERLLAIGEATLKIPGELE